MQECLKNKYKSQCLNTRADRKCLFCRFIIISALFIIAHVDTIETYQSDLPKIIAIQSDLNTLELALRDASFLDNQLQSLHVPTDTQVRLYFLGNDLHSNSVMLTSQKANLGTKCDFVSKNHVLQSIIPLYPSIDQSMYQSYEYSGQFSHKHFEPGDYYLCVQNANGSFHQGTNAWVRLHLYHNSFHNLSVLIVLGIIGLFLSALFSGLTLGIMTLDPNELKMLIRCGTKNEREYARNILPIRNQGNFILCTFVIGNTVADAMVTYITSLLFNGIYIVIIASTLIVIFGQILPFALSTRYGLALGAKTIYITKFFMVLTFIISYPLGKTLDHILGEEFVSVYDKERLMEYIRVTTPITKIETDELNIITGALSLNNKTVKEVMKNIDDVYMLPVTTMLNHETIGEISHKGYSRIPIYLDKKERVVGLLHVKDLTLINPNETISLVEILDKNKRPLIFTHQNEKLFILLNCMKQGKSHLAVVKETKDNNSSAIGVVTLEDIIEEILQTEIADETDIQADSYRQHKDAYPNVNRIVPNQWQWLALMHYLNEEIELFKPKMINRNILKRLLSNKIFFRVKIESQRQNSIYLFKKGVPCDFFILILEGKVEVEIGNEKLKFEAGSFTNFGIKSIQLSLEQINQLNTWLAEQCRQEYYKSIKSQNEPKNGIKINKKLTIISDIAKIINHNAYIPDFSLKVLETTFYLKINRITYATAFCASQAWEQYRQKSFSSLLQQEMDKQTDISSRPFVA